MEKDYIIIEGTRTKYEGKGVKGCLKRLKIKGLKVKVKRVLF